MSENSLPSPRKTPPEDLLPEVHSVLRALIHPHSRLQSTRLQTILPHLFSQHSTTSTHSMRTAMEQGLVRMQQRRPEMAALIRDRFWEGRSMQELSFGEGRSVSGLYALQAQALEDFARELWSLEQEQEGQHMQTMAHRCRNLPPATFPQLVGAEGHLAQIRDWLRDPHGPRIISIEGLGGLGKTALAYTAVQDALQTGSWADCAWVSAVDKPFFLWEAPNTPPPLDIDRILEQIALQLDFEDPTGMASEERRQRLQSRLSEQSCLVVLEDLEPEHRPKDFLPPLLTPTGATRFLITSRLRLPIIPGSANLVMGELSRADSLALLQVEASNHGLRMTEMQAEKAYQTVGGNPLALKLLVGQAVSLPMDRVLENLLDSVQGTPSGNMLQQVYRHSWKLLLPTARQILYTTVRFPPQGATYEELLTASGLKKDELDNALQQLVTHSLLYFNPDAANQYSIHRLTYIFLWTLQRGGAMNLLETQPAGHLRGNA